MHDYETQAQLHTDRRFNLATAMATNQPETLTSERNSLNPPLAVVTGASLKSDRNDKKKAATNTDD